MNEHRVVIYNEGRDARFDGKGRDENPYTEYSSDYTYWNDGWYDANDSLIRKPSGMGFGGYPIDEE